MVDIYFGIEFNVFNLLNKQNEYPLINIHRADKITAMALLLSDVFFTNIAIYLTF